MSSSAALLTTAPPAAVLRVRGLVKSYQATHALRGVDLTINAGEAHALLGENGAGKSTLLKILAGAEQPDRGSLAIDGVAQRLATPQAAIARGIATIYQELSLFPNLSIAENIAVGRLPRSRSGQVDWPALHRRARALLDRVGLELDPRRIVGTLSVAEQQLVEIARALSFDARVIIMDEPTATLSARETTRLQSLVGELTAGGTAVVFVTHRLEEVKAMCDRYSVLRDGAKVGEGRVADVSIDDLVQLMIGRSLASSGQGAAPAAGPAVLEVSALATLASDRAGQRTALDGIDFTAHPGEIVGIAGLVGSGRSELAHAIFGANPVRRGEVRVDGRVVRLRSPRDAIAAGIALVPEDRKRQGLFAQLSIGDNFALASLRRLSNRFGLIASARLHGELARYTRLLAIRMAGARQTIGALSGGNQQKVVLARWLARQPRVLIVDEPTRGIDIGAKSEVHALLRELARTGVAVVVISSEIAELAALADRIVTLRAGRVVDSYTRVAGDDAASVLTRINALGTAALAA